MAAHGRPIPPDEAPFRDRAPDDYPHPDSNPYLRSHREFGRPLLTAEELQAHPGRLDALFGRSAPLQLEIGCGNGAFLAELGRRNPDHNVLGIEIRFKRTVLGAQKIRNLGLSNTLIARYHAAYLRDFLVPGSLHRLHVHHPDPWPKDRHEKNRLISRWFLEDVALYLEPGGVFQMKSDFPPNIDRIQDLLDRGPDGEPLPRLPLRITGHSTDVNGAGAPWPDDIPTGYQIKKKLAGVPVHAIELTRDPA